MYLPGYYGDPVEEYWHLVEHVTLWDVGVERVIQISGPDALAFTNMLTCRDLTRCAVGQGKYAPLLAADGGIINDPVLLRVAEDRFLLCLADSDAGLWARGVALGAFCDGDRVGHVTDLIWSPRLRKNIGYVWVPVEHAGPVTERADFSAVRAP